MTSRVRPVNDLSYTGCLRGTTSFVTTVTTIWYIRMTLGKRQRIAEAGYKQEPSLKKLRAAETTSVQGTSEQEDDAKSQVSHDTDAIYDGEFDPALIDEEETSASSEPIDKQRLASNHGSGSYNALKSFNGQVYSGMTIGGSHKWNYDPGVWIETKTEPDLWTINYETTKRRARNAPKGSGAPVGTEYHWLIVAHQYVQKVDANTYETRLQGSKYKLAHKGPNTNSWSVNTIKGQREREIVLLEDAKRRVQGLPIVHAGEKVRVEHKEKGQQKLDGLFAKVQSNNKENEIHSKQ